MKIDYIYEAGVFGSYKKTNAQSNIDNVKKELSRDALNSVLENKCDEFADLYLDILNEVNSKIDTISSNYNYTTKTGFAYHACMLELSNYIVNTYFKTSRKNDTQLNIIKNVYCNRLAIEYMKSQGCFILPLVDTTNTWLVFNDSKDIISYKNMIKAIAEAAEKIIKSHLNVIKSDLSKFPSYASIIPNKVKIVILKDIFDTYPREQAAELLSYMGIANDSYFEYPIGQGSSCLNYILDNCNSLVCKFNMCPTKSYEHIWIALTEPSPWLFNKTALTSIKIDLPTAIKDDFYSIKLLKLALDNGVLSKRYTSFTVFIYDTENTKIIKELQRKVSNNGLDKYITYHYG